MGTLEEDCGSVWGDSEFVEVIGIGSRKDAVIDFCLNSPLQSSSVRFWNIFRRDSLKVHLQQRSIGRDITPVLVETFLSAQQHLKTIVLVASAGYGSDHITAIDILRTTRSANGLAIGVILKPFSFEGKRRQNEVKNLVERLQEHTNFCIVIDTDTLLKKDLVTLDEALKTADNGVLLAINAISVLISGMHKKLIDAPHDNMKELKGPEIIKILESHKEAKIGFGAGYNIETSILQAIYDCPFLSVCLKDLNGTVICILASSVIINNSDVLSFLHVFRKTTECTREIIISIIHEPNLEPNLIVTTVIILGSTGQLASQKSSILSQLAQHFPFIFNLLGGHHLQPNGTQESPSIEGPGLPKLINAHDSGEMQTGIPMDGIADDMDMYSEELQMLLGRNDHEINASRDSNGRYEQSELGCSEATIDSLNFNDQNTEGISAFQREPLIGWNLGPGDQIAQEWAKERAADSGATTTLDNLSIFHLPVGVRPLEELNDSPNISNTTQHPETKIGDEIKAQPLVTSRMPWDELTGAGFEAVMDLYNSASTVLKGKYADIPKKQGMLSVRAASMLESERDSQKKWSPIVQMQYRGGIYQGRCQGGLPEGKGRLSLRDGSIYDGMWRYGKRSGPGTLYFCNGDVFQGSWRDDVMHGKGWFYFHSGDRWFANFWKGKANGEGRFYSKFGDVFFGHFKDGWRHGHFLCINVNGERCVEVWDEGVLVSREQLDSDTGTG